MGDKRKFSLFISSTYEDLKEERQALLGVALESGFIPVGMEQFHGAPVDQWDVITQMIDECDFYLLIIGGRYGSIDETVDISYTEKEYDYAKSKGIPVLVLVKDSSSITDDKKDTGSNKYDLMMRLDVFRERVKNEKNTVDFFSDLNSLRYKSSATLKNAIMYADEDAGWIRYKDIIDVINEEAEGRNRTNAKAGDQHQKLLEEMRGMISEFEIRLSDLEKMQLTWKQMPLATKEDINNVFHVEGSTLVIGKRDRFNTPVVGKDDVGNVPLESAFLLVYAAEGDGKIMRFQTLSSPVRITTIGKQFMAEDSQRESARWQEALDRLVTWGWVKPIGYKGEIFELTGTGYNKAEWLKNAMNIDTSKEPLEELKEFDL